MFALYHEKGDVKILIQKSYDKDYLEKNAKLLRKGIYIGDLIPGLCLSSIAINSMSVLGNYTVEPFKEQL